MATMSCVLMRLKTRDQVLADETGRTSNGNSLATSAFLRSSDGGRQIAADGG